MSSPVGALAKEAGIARALSSRRSAQWRMAAHVRLAHLIRSGAQLLTSEDITAAIGQPPSPNQVGAVLNGFARAGLLERVEFVQAGRVNQHAALITRWRPTAAGISWADAEGAQGALWILG